MKKILPTLAIAVFLFAGAGLAGGGVVFAHEGQGDPPFSNESTDPADQFVHAPSHSHWTDVAFAPGGPGHFGHQHNPNCGNMHANYHDDIGPPHPGK